MIKKLFLAILIAVFSVQATDWWLMPDSAIIIESDSNYFTMKVKEKYGPCFVIDSCNLVVYNKFNKTIQLYNKLNSDPIRIFFRENITGIWRSK